MAAEDGVVQNLQILGKADKKQRSSQGKEGVPRGFKAKKQEENGLGIGGKQKEKNPSKQYNSKARKKGRGSKKELDGGAKRKKKKGSMTKKGT